MSALPVIDHPTLQQELDRKVYETLEWIILGVTNGRLMEEQASIGVDVLFMAVSGLVDRSFLTMISEAQAQCKEKMTLKRHFHAPDADQIVSYYWSPGDSEVVVSRRDSGVAVKGKVQRFETAKEAAEYMKVAGATLLDDGWVEL